jgi:hypothetical protein
MMKDQSPADIGMMREIEERLRARLIAVERDTESLRARVRFFGFALTVTLALLAVVAVYPDVIATTGIRSAKELLEIQHLVLVGEDGGRRGEWVVDEDGNARLSLLDHQGRARLNLSVKDGGFPGLSLSNSDGQSRAVLGMLPDETTTLVFADVGGVARAVLGLTSDDVANLVFADSRSRLGVALALDGSGIGSVIMPDTSEAVSSETNPGG